MAVNFTAQQQNAIDSRGGSLIVSAAAGSGKTAVLVQRVIDMITGENCVDIDRLLIVTFTNAAAAEMRGKIADALVGLLAKNPHSRALKRQLALLSSARIQTVHAFCSDIVRQYFSECGVNPSFRLMDGVESSILKEQSIGDALDKLFENSPSENFLKFVDNFCEERGDSRLQSLILLVYEKLRSHVSPEKWLAQSIALCEQGANIQDASELDFCVSTLEECKKKLDYHAHLLQNAYAQLEDEPKVFAKYSPAFADCAGFAKILSEALYLGWDKTFEVLASFEKPRLGAARGADKAFTDKMKYARDFFCDAIFEMKNETIIKPSCAIKSEMAETLPVLLGLCEAVEAFTAEYSELKLRRSALDFSDLEHKMIALLINPQTAAKTTLADEIGSEFAEILVDEFQDTNEIQECIFNSLKQETSGIFMVGDVKQSIYRFRLAEPSIFVDKYYSYDDYAQNPQSNRRRITLNKNFRSREEVLSLVNFIFAHTMTREFGSIDYNENEYLYTGSQYLGICPAEIYILETKSETRGEDDEDLTKTQYEAEFVAETISRQLQETQVTDDATGELRAARPADIAVLLSSFANKAPIFQSALQARGINCSGANRESLFSSLEVSVVRSLLAIIDNPRQDIPLLSVMRSPLYFYSPDELLEIRLASKKGDFFDQLLLCDTAKNRNFLADLEAFRLAAPDDGVAALIARIYARTSALGVFEALDNGEARRANLGELYSIAQTFENSGSRGLFAFLKYLERREDEATGTAEPSGDAVNIMSVHRSKGLEFPIVVLPDLSKRYNTDDLNGSLLMHKDIGIGIKLRHLDTKTEQKTQLQNAIMLRHRSQSREEELRKLYVAMTRAKEKLIMTIPLANAAGSLQKWGAMWQGDAIPTQAVAAQASNSMLVCAPLLKHPDCAQLREIAGMPESLRLGDPTGKLYCRVVEYQPAQIEEDAGNFADIEPLEQITLDIEKWKKLQRFEYPHASAVSLPSKLTPTGLRELEDDSAILDHSAEGPIIRMFRGSKDRAALGTLAHLCMQKCNYAKSRTPDGASHELDRLVVEGEITEQQREQIKPQFISNFCGSELGIIASQSECIREYQFSALINAAELLTNAPSDEEILMNGVIDLLILTPEGATIVDFKSDGVRAGGETAAAQKYLSQLSIYAKASEKILGVEVNKKIICFLSTGACVEL